MATRSVTAALTYEGEGNLSYPPDAPTAATTWYAEVGDQIQVTVNDASGTALSTWGEVTNASSGGGRLDAASGTSQSGTSSTTFLSTAIPSAGHGTSPTIPHMHFFSPTGGGAEYSGRLYINVPNPIISASANVNSPTTLVPVTLTVTTTHTKTGVVMTKSGSEPYWNTQNPHVYTYYQARNASETYYAGLYTSPGAEAQTHWRGTTSAGVAPSGTWGNGVTISAPGYIQPNTSNINLSSTSVSVTAGGTFTLPSVSTNYNSNEVIYMTTSTGSTWASNIVARTIGSAQLKDNSNQSSTTLTAPSSVGTTVYYLYSHRHANYGGPANWTASVVDSGAVKFTLTTTATAVTSTIEATDTNSYYYRVFGTSGLIRHFVAILNTSTAFDYRISTSSSSQVVGSSWSVGVGSGNKLYFTPSVPSGTSEAAEISSGARTFYLWRRPTGGGTEAYTNVSYTRTLVAQNASLGSDLSIASNATTINFQVTSTVAGFYYSLKATNTGTTVVSSVKATGTTLNLTTSGSTNLPGTSQGDTRTYELYVYSPAGFQPTTPWATGETIVVTRLGSGGSSSGSGVSSGSYGFALYNNASTPKLVLDSSATKTLAVFQGQTGSISNGSSSSVVSVGFTITSSDYIALAYPNTGVNVSNMDAYYVLKVNSSGGTTGALTHLKVYNNTGIAQTFTVMVMQK